MADRFITNFKKSLPDSLKKKLKLDEDGPTDKVNQSLDAEGDDESEMTEEGSEDLSEDSEEAANKKKMGMLIRVIAILVLAYLALDEFILNPKKENEVLPVVQTKPKKKLPQPEKIEKTAPTTNEGPSNDIPPVENINISSKEEVNKEEMIKEDVVKADVVSEAPPVSEETTKIVTESTETPAPIEEIKVETVMTSNAPTQAEIISKKAEEVAAKIPDTSIGEESKNSSTSMLEKIVESATETLPPLYDRPGRGLVYNCKDKYWACVDRESFVICNKNMKWNKFKGNPAECVVKDVYSTNEDCSKVQKYNVSSNQSTDFCQL